MTNRDEIEQIIETIKQHNVLYDNTLPSHKKKLKETIWEKIAAKYDMDVQSLKTKWKNLRDTYKKHIRSISGDTKVSEVYRNWHWSENLDFLRPYIINRGLNKELVYCDEKYDIETIVTENPENTIQIKVEQDNNFSSDSESFECLLKQKPKVKNKRKNSSPNFASDLENIECMIEQPKRTRLSDTKKNNENSENKNVQFNKFDGTELIFLGYAKTVKNMPLKRQISVKMKMAKIMMEEELKCVEEDEND